MYFSRIKDYIQKSAEILSTVSGTDVVICDETGLVFGDSDLETEAGYSLSPHSIVRAAMLNRAPIFLKDAKAENPSCKECPNSSTCCINAIIAHPILDSDTLIGGVGLYSRTDKSQAYLRDNPEALAEFIQRIIDLMVGKYHEEIENVQIQEKNERLRLLIQSLNDALVSIDEQNNITDVNSKFLTIFSLKRDELNHLDALTKALDSEDFSAFIRLALEQKKYSREITSVGEQRGVITFKPIFVGDNYRGALIYFKKNTEIYDEFNQIKNKYSHTTFRDIVGSSQELRIVKDRAKRFAKSPSTILIQGQSGTGKELFARAIHSASLRSKGPFVAVNCAAIPEHLLESELFGHKEGAFTGSMKGGKIGKFEFANKGTLFLDEVGELPLHLQSKLLRAIQERKIQPVGSNQSVPVDIRIIAATNRNIETMVQNREFREDLYYRLNVIPLYIPSLKERRSDVLDLMELFLEQYNQVLDKNVEGFDDTVKRQLYNYDWPGNIRELQNTIEYAVNDCDCKWITLENLPPKDFSATLEAVNLKLQPLKDVELLLLQEALRICGTTSKGKDQAAAALGISRATLYRKMKEFGITISDSEKMTHKRISTNPANPKHKFDRISSER